MNVQEILAQIDHAVTEIDLVLHEWQEGLDMMSFIYVDASFAMWTDEVPHRVVTSRNASLLPLQGIKEVRVMHQTPDGWTKVGTAQISEDGSIVTAKITADVPELKVPSLKDVSIRTEQLEDHGVFGWRDIYPIATLNTDVPLAHFHMREDGSVYDNYAGEMIVAPLEQRKREWNALEIVNDAIDKIEHHPFFRIKSDPDKEQ